MNSTPINQLTMKQKQILKIIFITLFLDLVGFSIIFPLFPQLAKYYLLKDPENVILKGILQGVQNFFSYAGAQNKTPIVLFGGALGALYSLLQFLAAPLWGQFSDRFGRRPILLISVSGIFLSYVLWAFSGSFTLLVIARFIGGLMGGNISTCSAVVADITDEKSRSKGMAIIGMAFAFGFIFGPAIGGLLSLWDLTASYPALEAYGINPFSVPAIFAGALALFNLVMIYRNFPETLPNFKRGNATQVRSINPFVLFKPLPYKGVNLANFAHFLFLVAFSGMEFTLTFFALDRFQFTSFQNGIMFVFIGFILAGIQGGFVRKRAHQIGEKKLSLTGLILLIPGLLMLAYGHSLFFFYGGLFFLACGAGMIIPCLTTLASLFAPRDEQGKVLGIFRSLGALARVIGPLLASLVYWKVSMESPYLWGALSLLIPIVLVLLIPQKGYLSDKSEQES